MCNSESAAINQPSYEPGKHLVKPRNLSPSSTIKALRDPLKAFIVKLGEFTC
jgi:hypothetical protein